MAERGCGRRHEHPSRMPRSHATSALLGQFGRTTGRASVSAAWVSGKPPFPHNCVRREEIAQGIVIRLDPGVLSKDPRVRATQKPHAARPGPFVCIAVYGEETIWAGVTTGPRWQRLPIEERWRYGGDRHWRLASQFLTDGASLW